MILFVAGDIFGRIHELYDRVFALEAKLGVRADWVLQTGNFGVFPDSLRADAHIRRQGGLDFVDLYYNKQGVPRPTLFVEGPHEDHDWLALKKSRGELELLPNLHLLWNGFKTQIGNNETDVSVVGLGKVYSEKTYRATEKRSEKRAMRHYTRGEVERACSQGPTDILLLHQAGYGRRIGPFVSNSEGISKIGFAVRPQLIVHGAYNISATYDAEQGTPSLALAYGEVRAITWSPSSFAYSVLS